MGLSADDQQKLQKYWDRFDEYLKCHSNELIAAWELHNLLQGTLSHEEFITKLRIIVKAANFPIRDFLVLSMNSDHTRKDFFLRKEIPCRLMNLKKRLY